MATLILIIDALLRGNMSSFKNDIYLLPGSCSRLVELFHLVCVAPFRGPYRLFGL